MRAEIENLKLHIKFASNPNLIFDRHQVIETACPIKAVQIFVSRTTNQRSINTQCIQALLNLISNSDSSSMNSIQFLLFILAVNALLIECFRMGYFGNKVLKRSKVQAYKADEDKYGLVKNKVRGLLLLIFPILKW